MNTRTFDSPIGPLLLHATETSIIGIDFMPTGVNKSIATRESWPILRELEQQLTEYFVGQRKVFDMPVHVSDESSGVLWESLRTIPYGKTISYTDFAALVGRPRAVRSVASTIGKNPLPILYPCHRVIGADGQLRGFRGGLDAKRWLLSAEGALQDG